MKNRLKLQEIPRGESSELSGATVAPSRDSMHPKGESQEPLSTLIPHMLLS